MVYECAPTSVWPASPHGFPASVGGVARRAAPRVTGKLAGELAGTRSSHDEDDDAWHGRPSELVDCWCWGCGVVMRSAEPGQLIGGRVAEGCSVDKLTGPNGQRVPRPRAGSLDRMQVGNTPFCYHYRNISYGLCVSSSTRRLCHSFFFLRLHCTSQQRQQHHPPPPSTPARADRPRCSHILAQWRSA